MLANFAHLIDTYGHIPNGNRTYYLSRSQPPFFAAMVARAADRDGESLYGKYLPQLLREHEFWMQGADRLVPGTAHRRVVRLRDGTVLNRYWDDRAAPRDEAWREDIETARQSGRPAAEVYRNLRATAESGWDFSSRWLADGRTLSTIRTIDILPVDLNALLHEMERAVEQEEFDISLLHHFLDVLDPAAADEGRGPDLAHFHDLGEDDFGADGARQPLELGLARLDRVVAGKLPDVGHDEADTRRGRSRFDKCLWTAGAVL
jgi:hypothetical protein